MGGLETHAGILHLERSALRTRNCWNFQKRGPPPPNFCLIVSFVFNGLLEETLTLEDTLQFWIVFALTLMYRVDI